MVSNKASQLRIQAEFCYWWSASLSRSMEIIRNTITLSHTQRAWVFRRESKPTMRFGNWVTLVWYLWRSRMYQSDCYPESTPHFDHGAECCCPHWYIYLLFNRILCLTNKISIPGLTHRVIHDDIHDGYFIPKDSLIIPNI